MSGKSICFNCLLLLLLLLLLFPIPLLSYLNITSFLVPVLITLSLITSLSICACNEIEKCSLII
ncbi:unnamed protein product [Brugia timori]|uniref:Uncharacterized protein n=1 Tax=Brugia timori TaxID=42155 RepID=A0A0R3QDF5_9BILA|nr:unnamed protein product [Brugia timori]